MYLFTNLRIFGLAICLMSLVSCQLLRAPQPPQIPAPLFYSDFSSLQEALITFGGSDFLAILAIDYCAPDLVIVGLTPLGQLMFSIKYDGHELDSDLSQIMPSMLNPEWILEDVLMIYATNRTVNLWSAQKGYVAEANLWSEQEGAYVQRFVDETGQSVATIERNSADGFAASDVTYSNQRQHYQLRLKRIELQLGPSDKCRGEV